MTTTDNSTDLPRSINAKLDKLEGAIGSLSFGTDEQALEILQGMDEINAQLARAQQAGDRLDTEWVQWDYIGRQVKKNANLLLKKIGGPSVLMKRRSELQADDNAWWWNLDQYLVQKRKAALRKTLIGLGGGVLLLALLAGAYQLFLAPPPEVSASYRHRIKAESAMQNGDVTAALAEVDLALSYTPEDYELLTIRSVLLEKSGDTQSAAEALARAQALAPDEMNVLMAQGQTSLYLQDAAGMRAAGERLEEGYPASPYGPIFLGSAAELEEDYPSALQYLAEAADRAEAQGDANLSGNLRVRIAMLTQKSLAPSDPTLNP
ncbi:MAG: hypothetical protein GYA48_13840 [Chloroflexi bacterium]|nr:hypothetical protein [Chloroflexota bacterium]